MVVRLQTKKGAVVIRPIMKSESFLRQPSAQAGPADVPVGRDLPEALWANRRQCAGMAANMIGVLA